MLIKILRNLSKFLSKIRTRGSLDLRNCQGKPKTDYRGMIPKNLACGAEIPPPQGSQKGALQGGGVLEGGGLKK